MGPYTTTFPNEIGHRTTLGRAFRTLRVPTKIVWGPGCHIYHSFLEWTGLYVNFDKQLLKNENKQHPIKLREEKQIFSKIAIEFS